MTEDEALDILLKQHAERYAELYPTIVPRLRQAYEAGNPMVKQIVRAMAAAHSRADSKREFRLRHEHGLTPTETKVAIHLGGGGTVASCAEALGVAASTIRTHLKSVFAKTGVSRQADLRSLVDGR